MRERWTQLGRKQIIIASMVRATWSCSWTIFWKEAKSIIKWLSRPLGKHSSFEVLRQRDGFAHVQSRILRLGLLRFIRLPSIPACLCCYWTSYKKSLACSSYFRKVPRRLLPIRKPHQHKLSVALDLTRLLNLTLSLFPYCQFQHSFLTVPRIPPTHFTFHSKMLSKPIFYYSATCKGGPILSAISILSWPRSVGVYRNSSRSIPLRRRQRDGI